MKSEDSATVAVGRVTILLLPLFAAWRSFVATKLWAWFVVSTFGLPALSMPTAYGIMLVSAMFVPHTQCDSKDGGMSRAIGKIVGLQVAWPAFALLLGWIVKGML